MPLLKLWNSIRGRSKPAAQQGTPAAGTSSAGGAKPTASRRSRGEKGKRATQGRGTAVGRLSLFGGGGPHAGLRRLIKPITASNVLEIGVGDGSRAIAIVQTLGDAQPVRYVAIDQFEMADGEITLKAFHRTLRSAGIRPQVFPDTIDRGLMRVANTVGQIDLVIVAADADHWRTPETLSLLARITHSQTVVLFRDEEGWERFEPSTSASVRRAA